MSKLTEIFAVSAVVVISISIIWYAIYNFPDVKGGHMEVQPTTIMITKDSTGLYGNVTFELKNTTNETMYIGTLEYDICNDFIIQHCVKDYGYNKINKINLQNILPNETIYVSDSILIFLNHKEDVKLIDDYWNKGGKLVVKGSVTYIGETPPLPSMEDAQFYQVTFNKFMQVYRLDNNG